jgi:HPt (histidine-containing phosphotransfer) domain-containing protein
VTTDDPAKIRRITGKYIEQAEETLASLTQAIQARSASQVRFVAHRLCGSSASCGIVAMVAPLKSVEQMGEAGQFEGLAAAAGEAARQFARVRHFLLQHLQQLPSDK